MIPVYEPQIDQEEIDAVVAALKRGEISGSFGESIPRFEQMFAEYCGCKYGVAVSSGTTALQLAVAAAVIKQGDEVLVSASTNIATALAAYHNGAVPVPVDSEKQTWNINLDLIKPLITSRTRAIIPVHLFGHPVDMDRLVEIARRHNLVIIEDCAEAHGAKCRDRMVGSFGDMGCFSFYANKVITTGEGGMVTTNSREYADKLRLLRNLGFMRPRFWHEQAGFNFRMTGYQAAMGCVQCQKLEFIVAQKRRIARLYTEVLSDIPGLQQPMEENWARHVYWMYPIVVKPEFGMTRDQLTSFLERKCIETRTFFCPMNLQPCLRSQAGFRNIECPVAEELWHSGMYLPSSPSLSEEAIRYIAQTIREAQCVPQSVFSQAQIQFMT